MYRKNRQVSLFDFDMSGARLDPDNFWLRLADEIPWDEIEDKYSKKFASSGPRAISARCAVGSLMVKRILKCTDDRTVRHISENPYIQSFIGLTSFTVKCPFGTSSMARFRARIDEEDLIELDAIAQSCAR